MKDSVKDEALPQGITLDRPVVFKPKRGTYLDMWQSCLVNGTDQLLAISGTALGVIDVHLTFTLVGLSAAHSRATSSTVALGTFGYFCLDTNNKIAPTNLPTLNY